VAATSVAAWLVALLAATMWLIISGYACVHLWFVYLKYAARAYRSEVERTV
jgi:hypothetical protein